MQSKTNCFRQVFAKYRLNAKFILLNTGDGDFFGVFFPLLSGKSTYTFSIRQ